MFVLNFKLANALLLGGQWFAYAWLAELLGIELREPASDGGLTQFHVPADLADTKRLIADHLHNLQFEAGIKDSSFLFCHDSRPSVFLLSSCAK